MRERDREPVILAGQPRRQAARRGTGGLARPPTRRDQVSHPRRAVRKDAPWRDRARRRRALGHRHRPGRTPDGFWACRWPCRRPRSTGGRSSRASSPAVLRGVDFIVSDDHSGLRAARRAVLGGATWQRCQFHLARNAIHHAPNWVGARFCETVPSAISGRNGSGPCLAKQRIHPARRRPPPVGARPQRWRRRGRGRWSRSAFRRNGNWRLSRLCRARAFDAVSRDLNVPVHRLTEWRDKVLTGAESALKERERDARDEEIARLQAKVGEITMDNELLYAKIDTLEGGRPLARRRSKT